MKRSKIVKLQWLKNVRKCVGAHPLEIKSINNVGNPPSYLNRPKKGFP